MKYACLLACAVAGLCVTALILANEIWPLPVEDIRRIPSSPVITDRQGNLLLVATGSDGQWRLPIPRGDLGAPLIQATVAVEDERFYEHVGVDPIAILRAVTQNLASRRVVSGASTITMQIARMLDPQPRTWTTKVIEGYRALQLELTFNKDKLIELYLNLAPYGGNIRGAEAAARSYFNKPAAHLTLDEAAMLAGLPQSPERLRPDRFPQAAQRRRAHVINRLVDGGRLNPSDANTLGKTSLKLATWDRPRKPSTFALAAINRRPTGGMSTIDPALQSVAEDAVARHKHELPPGAQSALLIMDIDDASIAAWIGNSDETDRRTGCVDGVLARRSPGSTLKPFFYAAAFEQRRLHPESVVTDRPTSFAEWRPRNYAHQFAGEVTAGAALRRSLNIPAIAIANQLGIDSCVATLNNAGFSIDPAAVRRAGLSLVTGGIETRLIDLVSAYSVFARGGRYQRPRFFIDEPHSVGVQVFSRPTCQAINHCLSNIQRAPPALRSAILSHQGWYMWKTGTSAARRDAWAIGHNGRYAIGVWVGRFSGAPHPRFVGALAAVPLLRSLFESPAIRSMAIDEPPPCPKWPVENQLKVNKSSREQLRIVNPAPDSRYQALDGRTILNCRVNLDAPVSWFVDGRYHGRDISLRIALAVGHHKLRAVAVDGTSDCVTIEVAGPLRTP